MLVDSDMTMTFCDGDYVYYTDYGNTYAAVDINGNNVVNITRDSDEFRYDLFIKGNKVYYISDTGLHVRNRNGGNSKRICSVSDWSDINNVTENYIYYSNVKKVPSVDYGDYTLNYIAYANCVSRWQQ